MRTGSKIILDRRIRLLEVDLSFKQHTFSLPMGWQYKCLWIQRPEGMVFPYYSIRMNDAYLNQGCEALLVQDKHVHQGGTLVEVPCNIDSNTVVSLDLDLYADRLGRVVLWAEHDVAYGPR